MAGKTTKTIELPKTDYRIVELRVIGDSPLIVHAFGEKGRKEIALRESGKARNKKAPRDEKLIREEFESCRHRMPDGSDGFPSNGFRLAAINACRLVDGVPMTLAKLAFRVNIGEPLTKIEYEGEPVMREDVVRVGGKGKGTGTATMRYRPEYWPWSATLKVRYNANVISLDQVVSLFNLAGDVGIGEWRPEKDGDFGTFHVEAE
jgi:hypothetical protein